MGLPIGIRLIHSSSVFTVINSIKLGLYKYTLFIPDVRSAVLGQR